MRFSVTSRDVPTDIAAKRLGLSVVKFQGILDRLYQRGFPHPDQDTGQFDMQAIDRWCDARNPHLFKEVAEVGALDAKSVVTQRLEKMRAGRG